MYHTIKETTGERAHYKREFVLSTFDKEKDVIKFINEYSTQFKYQFKLGSVFNGYRIYTLNILEILELWRYADIIALFAEKTITDVLCFKHRKQIKELFSCLNHWSKTNYENLFSLTKANSVDAESEEFKQFELFKNVWCGDMLDIMYTAHSMFKSPETFSYGNIKILSPIQLSQPDFKEIFSNNSPLFSELDGRIRSDFFLRFSLILRACLIKYDPVIGYITVFKAQTHKKAHFYHILQSPWKRFCKHSNLIMPCTNTELAHVLKSLKIANPDNSLKRATEQDILKIANEFRKELFLPLYIKGSNINEIVNIIEQMYGKDAETNTFNIHVCKPIQSSSSSSKKRTSSSSSSTSTSKKQRPAPIIQKIRIL